jgi:5'-3' exonuclease
VVDGTEVQRRYGVRPDQYAELAILRGDPSDGLPGVPGIGEKTAAGLLGRFGSLREALTAAEADPAAVPRGPALLASAPYLHAALAVVPVRTDVPLPPDLDPTLPRVPAHEDRLLDVAERWGLAGPVSRLVTALSQSTVS